MGGFRGSLASFSAPQVFLSPLILAHKPFSAPKSQPPRGLFPQLGALAISAALERANCPKDKVDEVYMGAVLQVLKTHSW